MYPQYKVLLGNHLCTRAVVIDSTEHNGLNFVGIRTTEGLFGVMLEAQFLSSHWFFSLIISTLCQGRVCNIIPHGDYTVYIELCPRHSAIE